MVSKTGNPFFYKYSSVARLQMSWTEKPWTLQDEAIDYVVQVGSWYP